MFLSFSLGFETFAQTDFRFADSTATWQVLIIQPAIFSPVIWKYTEDYGVSGDTVILGKPYQVIQSNLWVRKDSLQRVYYLDDQLEEQLLFDFNLGVGDTFSSEQNSPFLRVDSVDTVNWGGAKKRMFLSCIAVNCYYEDEVWVEAIGNLNSSLYNPFSRRMPTDGPSYELLCYSEEDTIRYQNPDYNTCYHDTTIYLSVQDISHEDLKIFPNPASETIIISLPNTHYLPQSISITDLNGKQILQTTQTEIPVSHLSKGLYFVRVEFANGKSVVKKIIIR